MTERPTRMKFGIFLAPFHHSGENPTLAIDRDIELIVHLDRLGFDEAWIGEHHSAGWELIADPALIIAAVAPRTRSIMLGTGVTSLPYHHPLMVADRMVQLDHMTRGRAMLGVGPGALSSDAYMMGIEPTSQRQRMNEALAGIMALLRSPDPVNMETDWFTLRDARLQIANYTQPHLPVAVAHSFSPAGPQAAGRYGVGMLSVASFQAGGLISLPEAWGWAEEAARAAGTTVRREDWRVVIPIHIADTKQQAIDDVRNGALQWNTEYFAQTLGRPTAPGTETIESMIERGGAIIGTPADAIEAVEKIIELSDGGIGGLLGLAHEWAGSQERIFRSYDLWARHVAPHFQGAIAPVRSSQDWVAGHKGDIFGPPGAAVRKAFEDGGVSLPEGMENQFQRGRT
ncbi:MAG: LLM class flavin-dependent oxidoreductase [Chloroflexi bacterium]|nr:LLM class flavin-dependent oxidoreductase [Chloroflexota bacterium]MDA1001789.1 LLM class flavin-dependent oxidoreductase [Chloroflexota bacterium]